MIRSLSVIQYQYNIASVTSTMNSAMGHLEKLYNAIRGTIIKHINTGFIPEYVDTNLKDPEQIPQLKTRNTFDRSDYKIILETLADFFKHMVIHNYLEVKNNYANILYNGYISCCYYCIVFTIIIDF